MVDPLTPDIGGLRFQLTIPPPDDFRIYARLRRLQAARFARQGRGRRIIGASLAALGIVLLAGAAVMWRGWGHVALTFATAPRPFSVSGAPLLIVAALIFLAGCAAAALGSGRARRSLMQSMHKASLAAPPVRLDLGEDGLRLAQPGSVSVIAWGACDELRREKTAFFLVFNGRTHGLAVPHTAFETADAQKACASFIRSKLRAAADPG